VADTYAGLVGAIIIGRADALDPTSLRARDVDR
jgi:hypothetical protein